MKLPRILFLFACLLPSAVLCSTDSLRTGFYVRSSVKFSGNFTLNYQYREYASLEKRWGTDFGIGMNFKTGRHFFMHVGLDHQSAGGLYKDTDSSFYAATGAVTYSYARFIASNLYPHFGFSIPFGGRKVYGRAGLEAGITTGAGVKVNDFLDRTLTQKEVGGRGFGFGGACFLQAGYRPGKAIMIWAGYTFSGSGWKVNKESGWTYYHSRANGMYHAFTVNFCINFAS